MGEKRSRRFGKLGGGEGVGNAAGRLRRGSAVRKPCRGRDGCEECCCHGDGGRSGLRQDENGCVRSESGRQKVPHMEHGALG